MIMNSCAKGGDNDMFWNECGSGMLTQLKEYCLILFNNTKLNSTTYDGPFGYNPTMFQPHYIPALYGMNYAAASNIIFT